jgi:hypothetical protein
MNPAANFGPWQWVVVAAVTATEGGGGEVNSNAGRPGRVWRLIFDWCDDAHDVSEWQLFSVVWDFFVCVCQTHTS